MSAAAGKIIKKRFFSHSVVAITVLVDFEPGVGKDYSTGDQIALARLDGGSLKTYGDQAKILFASGFFENPQVLKVIGTDDQFNAWVRTRPSVLSKQPGSESDPIEAAHVRTVEDGAGVGLKNHYATIPLLQSEHRLQHDKGYSAIGGLEKCVGWRSRMRQQWAKECIKYRLGGFASFADIPPAYFSAWCRARGIEIYLPKAYRESAA